MNVYNYQLLKNRKKLIELLSYARSNVPAYRKIKRDVSYYISSYEAWCELPIIKKDDIKLNWDNFIKNKDILDNPNAILQHTSGSSGEPLRIIKNRQEELRLTKKMWKTRKMFHKDIMKWKLLYFYRNLESNKLNALRIGDNNDYLDLSEKSFEKYINEILEFDPDWIIGAPIAVNKFANFCGDRNIVLSNIKMVELYGEQILPYQKNNIATKICNNIINHYGSRETGIISYQCFNEYMHAWDDELFFELFESGKPTMSDGLGELVVTVLSNKEMPLIRYVLGDYVKMKYHQKQCSCGNKSLITIEPIGGRISDLVYTSKKIVSSGIFDTIFSRFILKYPGLIKEFQVIQKDRGIFDIKIVQENKIDSIALKEIQNTLNEYLDEPQINFEYVDSIKSMNSGKTKSFISLKK
ncbi:phenylacetate--CoA ligase family protein [Clostridium cibarium]|uniref:Phenylacetate--CoA ligase family protein n=1 Tax=Clostridium cibarium TaxID=2762247 RepID=A0ABR8PY36_9CLOT|nr:phenylacetate--CoA ligase family protein [Clostridium cibarium]MBD7913064.1 phenylacetate--CoA ligase family protein [Clostridium cibarium]